MLEIIIYIVIAILSFILGIVVAGISMNKNPDGIFHVDTTNPDKDVFTLEVLIPLGTIEKKAGLYFKVKNDSL